MRAPCTVVSTTEDMNREPNPATTRSTSTPSGVETVTLSSSSTGGTLPAAPAGSRRIDAFVAARTPAWTELVALLDRAGGRIDRLPADDVLRLGEGYRAAAGDLARARQRWPGDPVVAELDELVGRARALVYGTPGARRSFRHWITTGFFQRVRERPLALLAAVVLLWGPSIGLALWAHHDPATATRVRIPRR